MFQFDGVSRAQVTPFWAFGLFFNAANEYVSHLCVCIYRCVYVCTCEGLLSTWIEKKGLDSEDLGRRLNFFIDAPKTDKHSALLIFHFFPVGGYHSLACLWGWGSDRAPGCSLWTVRGCARAQWGCL